MIPKKLWLIIKCPSLCDKFRVSPIQGLPSHKEFHVLSLLSPFKSTINCRLNSHLQVPNPNLTPKFHIVSPLYSIYSIFLLSFHYVNISSHYPFYIPLSSHSIPIILPFIDDLSIGEAGRSCLQSPWCIPLYRVPRGTNVALVPVRAMRNVRADGWCGWKYPMGNTWKCHIDPYRFMFCYQSISTL